MYETVKQLYVSPYAATPTPNRGPSTWLGSLRSGERGGGRGSGSGGSSNAVIIVAEVLEVAVISGSKW